MEGFNLVPRVLSFPLSRFNPSTPKSDWQLISPGHITLESNIKVTRIKELITSTAFRKCTVNSTENMLTDVRTLRVKREDPVERPPRKEFYNVIKVT